MNKEKLLYEAPTALTFVVKVQGMICQSPGYSANGLQRGNIVDPSGYFDEWDD